MKTIFVPVLLVLILTVFSPTLLADNTLKHDPFTPPPLTEKFKDKIEINGSTFNEELQWRPSLTAVMVAGKNSLITLDGTIIKIGEVKDGFRLVEVRENEAVFKKGNKRLVLQVKAREIIFNNHLERESANHSLSSQNKEQDNPK